MTVPQALRADLARHLAEYVGPNPEDHVFTMQRGGPMRRGNFNPATNWKENVTAIGVPDLHFTICGIPEIPSPRRQAVACEIL